MEHIEYYSLSHSQKRIWYSELVYPDTGFANLAGSVVYNVETVDFDCLKKAINLVIMSYDALRIRMVNTEEYDVKQYIAAYEEKDFDTFESESLNNLILEESKRPFSLTDGELFYLALIKNSEDKCGYYFKYHHIICDAMSVTLLNKRIYALYKALVSGEGALEESEIPSFIEFLNRDEDYLDSSLYKIDEAFWQGEFKDVPKPLDLFQKIPKTISTEREVHNLGNDMTASLNEFCKRNNTTVFRFFMSVFYIYFMRITSSDDIVISTGHHNRIDDRERQMAGMTVSTLPIRICIDESINFCTLLEYVTNKVSECLSHQRYPYDLLALNLRERGFDPKDLLGITLNQIPSLTEDYKVERYTPGFDPALLNIKINPNQLPKGAPIEISIDYRVDLFDYIDIRRLFSRLETLISDIIKNPWKKLHELEMLPYEEKQLILGEFNNTLKDYPKNKCIHQLFIEQAAKTPKNTALVFKDKKYTYDELNKKTNQLARLLRKLGVRPNDCVGIMVERSEDIVIGAMAVFKAGGGYLPVDPGFPKERIDFMLEEAEVKILLSQKDLKDRCRLNFSGYWLELDDGGIYSEEGSDIDNINTTKDLAYIIYTSGSSGNPKGVMVEHGNLLNFCMWYKDFYVLTGSDRQAAYCSFVFDVSIADLYPPLIVGASIHIIPEEVRLSPYELDEYFNSNDITVAFLPTKVGEVFVETAHNKSLRILTLGGEKLIGSKHGQYRLVNAYGPTEATIYATTLLVEEDYENVPIGKPLSNMYAYVVDGYDNLLPIGVPGELWISGIQVSRGYLKRPELTEEKFCINPFSSIEDSYRVYKTGDLARWLPDGKLEFLGRIDGQVKVRGFRIELQEIEQQLIKYPDICQAVVLELSNTRGSNFLCAYLVMVKDIDIKELEKYLRLKLPDYMIPAHFIKVNEIPLTKNGKTDKRVLQEFAKDHLVKKQRNIVKPRNQTEQKLSHMWKELLKLSEVSIAESFFDVGGHSLLAFRLFVMIKEVFGLSLPVSILFKENTIEKLALIIDGKNINGISALVPLTTEGSKQTLFCIHDFTGEVLPYINLAEYMGDEYPVYGLRYIPCTNSYKDVSIENMASYYIKEIRTIRPHGPYYLIGYSSGGTIAYEMAQQLLEQGDEVALLALLDTPNYCVYPFAVRYIYLLLLRYGVEFIRALSSKNLGELSKSNSNNIRMKILGKALGRYIPKNYPGKLTLFKAERRILHVDKKLGWSGLVEEKIDVYEVGGAHMFMLKKEISMKIANFIKKIIGSDVV